MEVSRGLFSKPDVYTRRLNYYGVLMAGMMKGDAVEDIAASCMKQFLAKHFDERSYLTKHPEHRQRVPTITRIINCWGFHHIEDDLF